MGIEPGTSEILPTMPTSHARDILNNIICFYKVTFLELVKCTINTDEYKFAIAVDLALYMDIFYKKK